jgi:hypothetical protein
MTAAQYATPSPFEDSQDAEGDVYQMMIDSASRNDQERLKVCVSNMVVGSDAYRNTRHI